MTATVVLSSDAAAAPRKPTKASEKKPDAKKSDAKADAQPGKPALVASFGDWGAYATSGRSKTCYALAQPKERQPAKLARDPGYVFVSTRPGEGVRNEVSVVMGFEVKADSTPRAEIGATNFDLVAKGANLWIKNAAEEGQFVDSLRKGRQLVVKAQSKRGNATTDTYVLSGLAQALDRVQKDCQ